MDDRETPEQLATLIDQLRQDLIMGNKGGRIAAEAIADHVEKGADLSAHIPVLPQEGPPIQVLEMR